MEQNTSLSARIRRRNNCGFAGIGSYNGVGPKHTYGDYTDPDQNHKDVDYKNAKVKKQKVGFRPSKFTKFSINSAGMTKKYANRHQKIKK